MLRTYLLILWMVVCVSGGVRGQAMSDDAALAMMRAREAASEPLMAEGTVTRVLWDADGHSVRFLRPGHGWMRCWFADGTIASSDAPTNDVSDRVLARRIPWPQWQETLLSPNGRWLARCKDFNIVLESQGDAGETIAVTSDGEAKRRYGVTSWVYREDQAQFAGMWWSADSKRLAFVRFDERGIPDHYLTTGLTDPHTAVRVDAYPLPGGRIPRLDLQVYHLPEKRTVGIDCGVNTNQYVYNIRFAPDGQRLLFHRLDRPQKHMQAMVADIETGASRVVAEASRPHTWVLNHPIMTFLKEGHRFIWGSYPGQRDWASLEIRDLDGKHILNLTDGNVPVGGVTRVDEDRGWIY